MSAIIIIVPIFTFWEFNLILIKSFNIHILILLIRDDKG
jgi:hypothetical protein